MTVPTSPIWKLLDADREFFERELDSFVPDTVYDAHIHLGRRSDYGPLHRELMANTPEVADMKSHRSHMEWLLPGRKRQGALVIASTLSGDRRDAGNRFATDQAKGDSESGSALVIDPKMAADELHEEIRTYRPSALKCYHLMSDRERSFDSSLEEYLPEHLVRVADEAELAILIHLVLDRALSDTRNQRAIRRFCKRYPKMTMVLAHGARGLNPSHTVYGLDAIKGFDNICFDTSSVMEGGCIEAILKIFGPSKVMWASDYPFSHLHGRCVAINDGFIWLYDNMPVARDTSHPGIEFALTGLEALRTLKYASIHSNLTDSQVEAIFRKNARALFGPA